MHTVTGVTVVNQLVRNVHHGVTNRREYIPAEFSGFDAESFIAPIAYLSAVGAYTLSTIQW